LEWPNSLRCIAAGANTHSVSTIKDENHWQARHSSTGSVTDGQHEGDYHEEILFIAIAALSFAVFTAALAPVANAGTAYSNPPNENQGNSS
jgi:hypothetical protein